VIESRPYESSRSLRQPARSAPLIGVRAKLVDPQHGPLGQFGGERAKFGLRCRDLLATPRHPAAQADLLRANCACPALLTWQPDHDIAVSGRPCGSRSDLRGSWPSSVLPLGVTSTVGAASHRLRIGSPHRHRRLHNTAAEATPTIVVAPCAIAASPTASPLPTLVSESGRAIASQFSGPGVSTCSVLWPRSVGGGARASEGETTGLCANLREHALSAIEPAPRPSKRDQHTARGLERRDPSSRHDASRPLPSRLPDRSTERGLPNASTGPAANRSPAGAGPLARHAAISRSLAHTLPAALAST